MSDTPPAARRGRSRHRNRPAATPTGPAVSPPEAAAVSAIKSTRPARTGKPARGGGRRSEASTRDNDRNLRDLIGAGPTQLPVATALRARDADQPTEQDLADAERDLLIVRRNWTPDAK